MAPNTTARIASSTKSCVRHAVRSSAGRPAGERRAERPGELRAGEAPLRVAHPRQEERDESKDRAGDRDGARKRDGCLHDGLPVGEFAEKVACATTWPASTHAASNDAR